MTQEHEAGADRQFERYALYWMPEPGSPLADFGRGWFGHDPEMGGHVIQCDDRGLGLDCLEQITSTPRRYGFHATLLAPFHLRAAMAASDLSNRLERFAAERGPVNIGRLQLERIDDFLALTPQSDVFALKAFQTQCAFAFDRFRAPLSGAERARRLTPGLSLQQRLMLAQWGYPHVLADFRFHLTLTGPLAESEADRISSRLAANLEDICAPPLILRSISLCGDPGAGEPLRMLARFPLEG